jgi:hypothetical protein
MQLVPTSFPLAPTSVYTGLGSSRVTTPFPRTQVHPQDLQWIDVPQQAVQPEQHQAPVVIIQTVVAVQPNDDGCQLTNQVSAVQRPLTDQSSQFMWPVQPQELRDNFQLVDLSFLADGVLWTNESTTSTLRISNWTQLPGRSGSFIRLREVPEMGGGMVFFPWANHRRLEFPDKPELIMEFQNRTVVGGPFIITLEPEDALVWCPAHYIWPACVVCKKFLFPCDEHRCSWGHRRKVAWWRQSLHSLSDVYSSRRWYAPGFVQKNLRGLTNQW